MTSEQNDPETALGLSTDEVARLMVASIVAAPEGYITESDMKAIHKWAVDARTDYALLLTVLNGGVGVRIANGEPSFCGLTDAESALADEMVEGMREGLAQATATEPTRTEQP